MRRRLSCPTRSPPPGEPITCPSTSGWRFPRPSWTGSGRGHAYGGSSPCTSRSCRVRRTRRRKRLDCRRCCRRGSVSRACTWSRSWTTTTGHGAEELYRPGGLRGRDLTSVRLEDKQDNEVVTDRAGAADRPHDPACVDGVRRSPVAGCPGRRSGAGAPATAGLSVTDKADRAVYIGIGVGGLLGFVLTLGARAAATWQAEAVRASEYSRSSRGTYGQGGREDQAGRARP